MANLCCFLYALPILGWFVFTVVRNIAAAVSYLNKRRNRNCSTNGAIFEIGARVQDICAFASATQPILRMVKSSCIEAHMEIPHLPGFRAILTLSDTAVERLPREQLEAVVAHEIGHLRQRHISTLAIVNFISRWTMMGDGFLAGWVRESQHLEKEADAFAVTWLEEGRKPLLDRSCLTAAIRTLEQQRIAQALRQMSPLDALGIENGDWLSLELRKAVGQYRQKNLFGKWKVIGRLCFAIYYRGWQATYVYQPYSERLRAILALPNETPQTCVI